MLLEGGQFIMGIHTPLIHDKSQQTQVLEVLKIHDYTL